MTKTYALIRDVAITKVDIATQRERAGITIRQMANLMKIERSLYSRMERGQRYMSKVQYDKFNMIIEKHGTNN